jgi:hypothetical protein
MTHNGAPPPTATAPVEPPSQDVAAGMRRAVEEAAPDALRLAVKAALAECGNQRQNAYRHGLPDSPGYRAVVDAAARVEYALIDTLAMRPASTPR